MSNDNILTKDISEMNNEELIQHWDLRKVMSDTNRNYAETQKLFAESKLMLAETKHTNKKTLWYVPFTFGAIAVAFGMFITKLLGI